MLPKTHLQMFKHYIANNPLFELNIAKSNCESEKAETYIEMEVLGATESKQSEKFENEDLSTLNDIDSKFILHLQDPDFEIYEAIIVKNEALYNGGEGGATNLEKSSETYLEYAQVCSISV